MAVSKYGLSHAF